MRDEADALVHIIGEQNVFQRRFLSSALTRLTDAERHDLSSYLRFWQLQGEGIASLAKAYNLVVKDTVKEQAYFQRHGRYRYSTFAEVEAFFAENAGYMTDYMCGLGLTTYFWPNHLQMLRHFRQVVKRAVSGGAYLEIGPGHGLYFIDAARHAICRNFTAVDVSADSVAITRSMLASGFFGEFPNCEVVQSDFMKWTPDASGRYSMIVAGEVLEHVENPATFLRKVRELIDPNGFAFFTTCTNAPEIDHIYLYSKVDDIEQQLVSNGWMIESRQLWPYTGRSLEDCEAAKLPVNAAYVVRPAGD